MTLSFKTQVMYRHTYLNRFMSFSCGMLSWLH